MNTADTFRTKNLYEAAFLISSNQKFSLEEIPKDNLFLFIFEEREFCEKLSESYWRGEAMVNAKAYSDAIRTLKDRMYNKGV